MPSTKYGNEGPSQATITNKYGANDVTAATTQSSGQYIAAVSYTTQYKLPASGIITSVKFCLPEYQLPGMAIIVFTVSSAATAFPVIKAISERVRITSVVGENTANFVGLQVDAGDYVGIAIGANGKLGNVPCISTTGQPVYFISTPVAGSMPTSSSVLSEGSNAGVLMPHFSYSLTTTAVPAMAGSTSVSDSVPGLVPSAPAGAQTKFLCADGTWKAPNSLNTAGLFFDHSSLMFPITAGTVSPEISVGGVSFRVSLDGASAIALQIKRTSTAFADTTVYLGGTSSTSNTVTAISENSAGNLNSTSFITPMTAGYVTTSYQRLALTMNLRGTSQNRLWEITLHRDGNNGGFLKVSYVGSAW